jgi:hypothetical protein
MGPFADFSMVNPNNKKNAKIKWIDAMADIKGRIATEIGQENPTLGGQPQKVNFESIIKRQNQRLGHTNSRNPNSVVASASLGSKDNKRASTAKTSHKQSARDASQDDNFKVNRQANLEAEHSSDTKNRKSGVKISKQGGNVNVPAKVIFSKDRLQEPTTKINNFVEEAINAQIQAKNEGVTQIINQNNINNIIIQNPQKVEVIEYVPTKKYFANEEPVLSKKTQMKGATIQRPSSASVKRDTYFYA